MNLDSLAKKLESVRNSESGAFNNKIKWAKIPKEKGVKFQFRILPYTESGDIGETRYYHFGVNDGSKQECGENIENGIECPICSVLKKYDFEDVKRYLKSGIIFFNVQLPSESDVVYCLSMSDYFITWMNDTIKLTGVTDIFDPKLGRDVIIWRKFKNGAFERNLSPVVRAISDTEDGINKLLKQTINFNKYFKKIDEGTLQITKSVAGVLDRNLYQLTHPEDDNIKDNTSNKEEEDSPGLDTSKSENESKEGNHPVCFGTGFSMDKKDCIECDFLSGCMTEMSGNE